MVPVGLAGLARTRPWGRSGSAANCATVGWNRDSGPQGSSSTVHPSAASMLRYAGYPGRAMTTVSPASNAARNASRKPPDEPVVTATELGATAIESVRR
jgi:hypothetical protein